METNKILSADVLDIVFDGRNKEYGAYQLRKSYNKRLSIALISTASVCILLFAGYILANSLNKERKSKEMVSAGRAAGGDQARGKAGRTATSASPKTTRSPKVEMAKFTPPKIVKDEEVKEEEKPPEVEKLEETKISTVNQEGVKDEGIVAPPVEDAGKGVVEAPKKSRRRLG